MKPRLVQRLLHLYWRVSRGMTLGVRVAAFDEAGRVLLVRHTYVPGWHLPGGGVEPGETMVEAAHKEVREEGNLVLPHAPVLFGIYFNRHVSDRDHVALFVARNVVQPSAHVPDREIAEARFFALDELPDGTTQATMRRLREIAGEMPVDLFW